jgi:hypothetical protein
LATISARDRLDLAITSPGRSRGAARQGRPRGADRIQRIGLARPPPVLPVRPVHLDDPDPGAGDVPGQASAIAAGALDADQTHRAEPAQPGQQPRIPRRRRRELLHAKQPADRVERCGHMRVRVRIHTAGNSACLIYDGQRHPFRR